MTPHGVANMLADHIVGELFTRFGIDANQITELQRAMVQASMPDSVRVDVERLLSWTSHSNARRDNTPIPELDSLYWSCMNIQRWLRSHPYA